MNNSVSKQFSASAELYAQSRIHSHGHTLKLVVDFARAEQVKLALDIATGAGHTAIAIARHAREVLATDISFRMLEVTRRLAKEQKLSNIRVLGTDAERLSFRADCFDLVTCRIAAHHFARPERFVREVSRVLKKGGRFILVDTWVPDDNVIKDFTNKIQRLRDPTHRRSLSTDEWKSIVAAAQLNLATLETWVREGEASFNEWISIARTTKGNVKELKVLFSTASDRIKQALKIKIYADDIFFQIPRLILLGRKERP